MPSESSDALDGDALNRELLRRLPLLSELPDEDLDSLCRMAELADVPAGRTIIEEGTPGDTLYVVVDGELEVVKRIGERDVVLAVRRDGDFVGERSLLVHAPRSASVRTLRESRLLVVSQAAFQTLLANSPSARTAILSAMISRLQATESMLMEYQKLASLGALAAGLAHELNNPSAAILRTSRYLQEVLTKWELLVSGVAADLLGPQQAATLSALQRKMIQRTETFQGNETADTLEKEEALEEWLESIGIPEAWNIAPELVAAGWDLAELEPLRQEFVPAHVSLLIQWLAINGSARISVDQIRRSSEAISEIVRAVKTYSYVGQAPVQQQLDLRDSLDNTLVILRNKLKQGVEVTRDYADDLPLIEAYGSELNQVWTNIIDNAIQAMQGRGKLGIRVARQDDEHVTVEISDSGPGIPPEVQTRIFEPFLTTKPPGTGTGLGLYIVYNIVVHRHHGQISVQSRPGETRFLVTLPVRLADHPPMEKPVEFDDVPI